MANKNILIKRNIIREREGIAILDLEKYREIERKIAEYERKEKLLRSLEKFESLAQWEEVSQKGKRLPRNNS